MYSSTQAPESPPLAVTSMAAWAAGPRLPMPSTVSHDQRTPTSDCRTPRSACVSGSGLLSTPATSPHSFHDFSTTPDLEKGLYSPSYFHAQGRGGSPLYHHSTPSSSEEDLSSGSAKIPLLVHLSGLRGLASGSPKMSSTRSLRLTQYVRSRIGRCARLMVVAFAISLMIFTFQSRVRHLVAPETWQFGDSLLSDLHFDYNQSPAALNESRESAAEFLSIPRINDGVVPFSPNLYDPLLPPRPYQKAVAQKAFSSVCADIWVSTGELCQSAEDQWADQPLQMDALWTWVNGSNEDPSAAWRAKVSDEIGFGTGTKVVPAKPILDAPAPPDPMSQSMAGAPDRARGSRLPAEQQGAPERERVSRAKRAFGATVVRHFREHDELRHSIRSVVASFGASTLKHLHLVVNDEPSLTPDGEKILIGDYPNSTILSQVPQWVNLERVQLSGVEPSPNATFFDGRNDRPVLKLHPHTSLFKKMIAPSSLENPAKDFRARQAAALKWRESVTPNFNSLAVESQLANVPEDTSDTLLALCDDFFTMRPMTLSDIESPLTGPVIRLQRDLIVESSPPDHLKGDAEGEWRGLGFTNWLLDQRFGARPRPYLLHVAKAISVPMLREVQSVFMEEMTATAGARFRGKAPYEMQLWFLLHHYTIEKHREALASLDLTLRSMPFGRLWSFFVARSDSDQDDRYSLAERLALMSELDIEPAAAVAAVASSNALLPYTVATPFRHTLAVQMQPEHDYTGLPRALESRYSFSSKDGYAFFKPAPKSILPTMAQDWPRFDQRHSAQLDEDLGVPPRSSPCTIDDLSVCFPKNFLDAESNSTMSVDETFRRLAFEQPKCGDCFIVQLLAKSGELGLTKFLPDAVKQDEEDAEIPVEVIGGTDKKWHDVTSFRGDLKGFTQRQRAVSLIQRYSYTMADTSTRFHSMRSPLPLMRDLAALSRIRPALIALNDDVTGDPSMIDVILGTWFKKEFPVPTIWEMEEEQEPSDQVTNLDS
ncbi:BZ3500_MvSof-1268-A1-R1_Chr5-3g08306 [Microbotryum saponariae]|uniref:BZ3500_MvSof-1268-A1-R1_Chr5-3g08306 protein n=1 Tax=Microbotryum saponariae TaxID=289078 RepID=A0A2X0LMM5_9BASI|nr:BZ3500_MvSof-1268-A1-R1_Chr5-3g08306 [Microbotryum saponariae]SDA08414.1 BZ3501_MvSof-1269-A2-R1_Chr5-3g08034 [Microbotryum saponariae]